MKILKCIICGGEVEIIENIFNNIINKKIKCLDCGFINESNKEPEIFIIRKRSK